MTNNQDTWGRQGHVENGTVLTYEKDIPQVEEMIPLTECLNDKGETLSQHNVKRITDRNLLGLYIQYPNSGIKSFLVPYKGMSKAVVNVPSGTTFVRDSRTQEELWGISAVAGG